jgi:hypothetical protein
MCEYNIHLYSQATGLYHVKRVWANDELTADYLAYDLAKSLDCSGFWVEKLDIPPKPSQSCGLQKND